MGAHMCLQCRDREFCQIPLRPECSVEKASGGNGTFVTPIMVLFTCNVYKHFIFSQQVRFKFAYKRLMITGYVEQSYK